MGDGVSGILLQQFVEFNTLFLSWIFGTPGITFPILSILETVKYQKWE